MLVIASFVREQFDRGKRIPALRAFLLFMICCLCIRSQLVAQDSLYHPPRPPQPPQPRVTCLHHEQTLAVVSLAPGNIVTRCRLILAEASDQFDKVQLLQHFSRKMPVERISFNEMLDVIRQGQENNFEADAQAM